MGIGYVLLDSASYYIMIVFQFPNLKFKQAMKVTLLGVFANISTFHAGTVPIQSYYLYRQGIGVGTGIGTMILECVFHKLAVFTYAMFVIVMHINWLRDTVPELMKYIYLGIVINASIIFILLLLCTWKKVQNILLIIINKLPDNEKWHERKVDWTANLEALYSESKRILKDRKCCWYVIATNLLKLFWVFSIPFVSMHILGYTSLSFKQTQILSSMMFLIIGVLPNVAGVGPTEVAFLMLFSPYIGYIAASSSLVLYRVADYFCPFIMSVFVFIKEKNNLMYDLKEKKLSK